MKIEFSMHAGKWDEASLRGWQAETNPNPAIRKPRWSCDYVCLFFGCFFSGLLPREPASGRRGIIAKVGTLHGVEWSGRRPMSKMYMKGVRDTGSVFEKAARCRGKWRACGCLFDLRGALLRGLAGISIC